MKIIKEESDTEIKSSTELSSFFTKKTEEQQLEQVLEGRKVKFLIRIIRNIWNNKDLLIMACIVIIFTSVGYLTAVLCYKMTAMDIAQSAKDFLYVLTAVILGITTLVARVITPSGPINEGLSKKATKIKNKTKNTVKKIVAKVAKPKQDLDPYGRTIPGE